MMYRSILFSSIIVYGIVYPAITNEQNRKYNYKQLWIFCNSNVTCWFFICENKNTPNRQNALRITNLELSATRRTTLYVRQSPDMLPTHQRIINSRCSCSVKHKFLLSNWRFFNNQMDFEPRIRHDIFQASTTYQNDYRVFPKTRRERHNWPKNRTESPEKPSAKHIAIDEETYVPLREGAKIPFNLLWDRKPIIQTNPMERFTMPVRNRLNQELL